MLRGEVVPLCADGGGDDRGDTDRGGIIEAMGDVPVVVRVEIGEARCRRATGPPWARETSSRSGDGSARAVTLRVGGVPVARGDLVEIEGEVGVRIVERLGGDGGRR